MAGSSDGARHAAVGRKVSQAGPRPKISAEPTFSRAMNGRGRTRTTTVPRVFG